MKKKNLNKKILKNDNFRKKEAPSSIFVFSVCTLNVSYDKYQISVMKQEGLKFKDVATGHFKDHLSIP